MAKKVNVVLVDDVDGSEADKTVNFSFDGASYEIDLSEKNFQKFQKELEKWVGPARRATAKGATVRTPKQSNAKEAAAVREWARENGHKVSERGRVSAELIALYRAAQ